MEVKGTVLQSFQKFVKERFQEPGLELWMESLSPEARALFSKPIIATNWYPITPMLTEPTQRLCDLFYGGDMRGAWESGSFSADQGLRGIYRMFVVAASPRFIITKGATVLSTFYRPALIEIVDLQPKAVTFHITRFPEPHATLEHRIGGWMEQGLVVCGCKGQKITLGRLMSQGAPFSEYHASWA